MEGAVPSSLQSLSQLLDSRSHLLAGPGDEDVAARALQAAKDIFDLGESQSHSPASSLRLQLFVPTDMQVSP